MFLGVSARCRRQRFIANDATGRSLWSDPDRGPAERRDASTVRRGRRIFTVVDTARRVVTAALDLHRPDLYNVLRFLYFFNLKNGF